LISLLEPTKAQIAAAVAALRNAVEGFRRQLGIEQEMLIREPQVKFDHEADLQNSSTAPGEWSIFLPNLFAND